MSKRFAGDYESFQRFNEEHKITYCDLEAEVWEAEELLKEKDEEIEDWMKISAEETERAEAAEQKVETMQPIVDAAYKYSGDCYKEENNCEDTICLALREVYL